MRRLIAVGAGVSFALVHTAAAAQTSPAVSTEPNRNWVFLLSLLILAGFLAFIGFVALYYTLAVVARNRRFATQAVTVAHAPAGTASPGSAPPAPAPAPATPAAPPAAPAPAPAATPAAAPAAAPKAAPAATGGVPRIDPNNLPDGIDAVTRGRLKKLAVLQERGQEPPAELLEELKGVLAGLGGAPAAEAPAAEPPAAETPALEAPAAQATAAEPAAEAPAAEEPAAEAPAAEAAPASTGGLPHIDVNNLPDGIDAVARGRLKKLAIFQERGQEPPADLVESLKPILDQIGG